MAIDMSARPRRTTAVVPPSSEDGSMIVTSAAGTAVSLNATAAALWLLCDGETSVAEIVTAATSFFVAPADTISGDVAQALDALAAQGLLVT